MKCANCERDLTNATSGYSAMGRSFCGGECWLRWNEKYPNAEDLSLPQSHYDHEHNVYIDEDVIAARKRFMETYGDNYIQSTRCDHEHNLPVGFERLKERRPVMNLYLLTRPLNKPAGRDECESAIVCAASESEARMTHPIENAPNYNEQDTFSWEWNLWIPPEKVVVKKVGIANPGTVRGSVICSHA